MQKKKYSPQPIVPHFFSALLCIAPPSPAHMQAAVASDSSTELEREKLFGLARRKKKLKNAKK
jgi:hypothetical protein